MLPNTLLVIMQNYPITIEKNNCLNECSKIKEILSNKGYNFNIDIIKNEVSSLKVKIGINTLNINNLRLLDE
jgi:hypothetical protein